MSFAVWPQKPPFEFSKDDPEQVYQVGSVWVVTNDSARATPAEVGVALTTPKPTLSDGQLAALLVKQSVITQAAVDAAAAAKPL